MVERHIEDLLAEAAASADDEAGTLREYVRGGKRLRARMVIAAGAAGPRWREEEVARFGAFVELIHAGGLCHDDVVDRSSRRRERVSIAFSHGSRVAAMAGLHLMFHAYALVARSSRVVRGAIARSAERVARGQADEMLDLHRVDVEPDRYLARCRAKTGALFELAAELGARATAVAPPARMCLVGFASELGLAFQLADDVRDLQGEAVGGRAPGTDLREGVYTLPVLATLQGRHRGAPVLQAHLRELRRSARQDEVIESVRQLLWSNGAVEASLLLAVDAMRRAREQILPLRGPARAILEGLAEAAVPSTLRSLHKATAA
jgi:heptaprenyl diphosphate synthase